MAVRAISNGHLLDEHYGKSGDLYVNSENNTVFSCILNQTDLKTNKNKFYIMQIIKTGDNYVHYIRYGRIGEIGTTSYKKFPDSNAATTSFIKQFRTKTGNSWHDKSQFEKKKGKYFMAEISYDEDIESDAKSDAKSDSNTKSDSKSEIPDSVLDERVQTLMMLFSDINMMKNTLIQLDIDTKKMPLGKIKQSQLKKAQNVLTQIAEQIKKLEKNPKKPHDSDLLSLISDLSSEYYTYIPYACGRDKPPTINSSDKLAQYNTVIEDLTNIVIATKIIEQKQVDVNPIDNIYNEMYTEIKPLDRESEIWSEIDKYINNSHGSTHYFKLKLTDMYQVNREGEEELYNKTYGAFENKELLIHGSRMCNWVSILKSGLMLDPEKLGVAISGKMFGYGIYFANSFSKSAQYCDAYSNNDKICLALAEVAVGKQSEQLYSDYRICKDTLNRTGHDSTWGIGQKTPESSVTIDGVKIPNGKLKESGKNASLRYDEKIVYDTDQFVIRYLVIAEMSW